MTKPARDDNPALAGFLGFPVMYGIDRAIHHNPRNSWFERAAGLRDGHYY